MTSGGVSASGPAPGLTAALDTRMSSPPYFCTWGAVHALWVPYGERRTAAATNELGWVWVGSPVARALAMSYQTQRPFCSGSGNVGIVQCATCDVPLPYPAAVLRAPAKGTHAKGMLSACLPTG